MSTQSPQPQWQPISMLPTITQAIDGMLESAQNTLSMLRQARPGSLDNYTIGRVVEVYTVPEPGAAGVLAAALAAAGLRRYRKGMQVV